MQGKKITCVLIAFFAVLSSANAQPSFSGDVEDVAPIPGLFVAAIAGILIGLRKIYPKE